eukprot:COSAG04_NODE_1070_length_8477_cov_17.005729_8_plen_261_part_00
MGGWAPGTSGWGNEGGWAPASFSAFNVNTMADIAAKVLQLSPEQHDALGHAVALAHAIHASIGGKGIGVAPGELADAYESVDIYVQPGQGGKGWWSTLSDAVEKGAKEIQSSAVVRGLEKKAVGAAQKYGTKALQGLADSALAETGIGEVLRSLNQTSPAPYPPTIPPRPLPSDIPTLRGPAPLPSSCDTSLLYREARYREARCHKREELPRAVPQFPLVANTLHLPQALSPFSIIFCLSAVSEHWCVPTPGRKYGGEPA